MARSPARLRATLGIQRWTTFAASGSHVAACGITGLTVPPVTFTWYQRGAANPEVFPRRTVCDAHSDSVPPKFVYWFCTMARFESESSSVAVPGCGTPAAKVGQLEAEIGMSGPGKVDSEMLFQSTWNL